MTDSIDNLILEHLKRFQGGQERIERELKEIKSRLSTLEGGQGSIVQHLGTSPVRSPVSRWPSTE